MKPRLSLVTLGVADLERAVRFYRDGLGWKTDGIVGQEIENGAVCFFELAGGLRLALWPRPSLAADTGLGRAAAAAPLAPASFSLAHNVASAAEVQQVMREAQAAGGRVVKPAQDTAWGGHAGYFEDTEGHLWEVAFNPAWTLPRD